MMFREFCVGKPRVKPWNVFGILAEAAGWPKCGEAIAAAVFSLE
jgi:hypothetical protein